MWACFLTHGDGSPSRGAPSHLGGKFWGVPPGSQMWRCVAPQFVTTACCPPRMCPPGYWVLNLACPPPWEAPSLIPLTLGPAPFESELTRPFLGVLNFLVRKNPCGGVYLKNPLGVKAHHYLGFNTTPNAQFAQKEPPICKPYQIPSITLNKA